MHPVGLSPVHGAAHPRALQGRCMARHGLRHLVPGIGRGWCVDCGEFEGAAKINLRGKTEEKCDFLKKMLAINRASFIVVESRQSVPAKNIK